MDRRSLFEAEAEVEAEGAKQLDWFFNPNLALQNGSNANIHRMMSGEHGWKFF